MQLPKLLNTAVFQAQKNAPSLLIGAGIASVVIGTVVACKATLKAAPILEDHKSDMEEAREKEGEEKKRDTVAIYKRTCCDLTKLYLPAAVMITIGVGCILGSNHIMSIRNAKLAAAVATFDNAFKQYRGRVINELGTEADERFRTGKKEVEIEEETVDSKGKTKKIKKKYEVADASAKGSGYLKYITPANPYWKDDDKLMEAWLNAEQNYANDIYKIYDSYVLKDCYERLGLKVNPDDDEALVMGWHRDHGDQFIDFNIGKRTYIPNDDGTLIPAYPVDFNVQCNVYAQIRRKKAKALKGVA